MADRERESVANVIAKHLSGRSDADDKLRQGQTVVEALGRCIEITEERRAESANSVGHAYNEFRLAREHMEAAQMRYTRGRAMQLGKFSPADLDAE